MTNDMNMFYSEFSGDCRNLNGDDNTMFRNVFGDVNGDNNIIYGTVYGKINGVNNKIYGEIRGYTDLSKNEILPKDDSKTGKKTVTVTSSNMSTNDYSNFLKKLKKRN